MSHRDMSQGGWRYGATPPVQRVRRAQTLLAASVVIAAALWAVVAGIAASMLVTLATAMLAHTGRVGPISVAALVWPVAGTAALGTLAVLLWRARTVWSLGHIALWLEERAPGLRYALVTLVDPRYAIRSAAASYRNEGYGHLVAAASQVDVERIVRRSAGRLLAWALAAVVASLAAVSLLQAAAVGSPAAGGSRGRPATVLGNRLLKLRAEVVPPAYSGLPRRIVIDPTAVAGLDGTTIRFLGGGPPDGVVAIIPRDTVARDTVTAAAARDGWAIPVPMPAVAGVLRLQDRQYHRAVSLEPLADSVPQLVLRAPATDTTWRWDHPPTGQLTLEADLADDYGLSSAYFEILVSSGSAETYDTRDRSTPRVGLGGRRTATLRATVRYRDLQTGPGTVLHIRAVAYDNNTVADSAGKGVSETRTLRVATKEEYDTLNVPAAPPLPIDSFFVSQRLLNMRTDTLTSTKKRALTPAQYHDTSIVYSHTQEMIRGRVEKVIALAEDDGVGGRFETDLSRLLRAASAEMYNAFVYLAIAQPDSAYVPPKSAMKEALRLLDEARKAQKYYLRGMLQKRPVNIALARLKAKEESAKAADRSPRDVPEDVRRALRTQLAAIVPVAAGAPPPALELLLDLKSAALRGGVPKVAAALQEAIDLVQRSQSAGRVASGEALRTALARAARVLSPPLHVLASPPAWSGGTLP